MPGGTRQSLHRALSHLTRQLRDCCAFVKDVSQQDNSGNLPESARSQWEKAATAQSCTPLNVCIFGEYFSTTAHKKQDISLPQHTARRTAVATYLNIDNLLYCHRTAVFPRTTAIEQAILWKQQKYCPLFLTMYY